MKAFEEEIETTVEISSNLMENHNNQVSSNLMENHDNQVSSNVMENQNSMLSDTERPISNPWPYISKYFEFITSENDGNQFIYKCLNCLPEMRLIKAQKRSLFGLRSHITRKHKQVSSITNQRNRLPRFNLAAVEEENLKCFLCVFVIWCVSSFTGSYI